MRHDVPELEALLPAAIDEIRLTKESSTGADALSDDVSGDSLRAFLASVGKTPRDLLIAQAYDATGQFDIVVLAFRIPGVGADAVAEALINSARASNPTITLASTTISGHPVITAADPDAGVGSYLYKYQDLVFDVETTDANLAAVVVGMLP